MIEVVDDTARPFGAVHLTDGRSGDRPLCGARPEGAYVVDAGRLHHVSCPGCIIMSNVPRPRRVAGGSS